MDFVEEEKTALISGIEADAVVEEAKILKAAEAQAAEKKKYAEKKVEAMLKSAGAKAQEQAEIIKKKAVSAVELEIKRRSMRLQGTAVQEILDKAETRLKSMIGGKEYRSILIGWIVEAAIGLDAESAKVNASQAERELIDGELLKDACGRVRSKTGKEVSLTLSGDVPLRGQGVALTASDGRTAFNNQVKTRMLRRQREIRELIYSGLFDDERKE